MEKHSSERSNRLEQSIAKLTLQQQQRQILFNGTEINKINQIKKQQQNKKIKDICEIENINKKEFWNQYKLRLVQISKFIGKKQINTVKLYLKQQKINQCLKQIEQEKNIIKQKLSNILNEQKNIQNAEQKMLHQLNRQTKYQWIKSLFKFKTHDPITKTKQIQNSQLLKAKTQFQYQLAQLSQMEKWYTRLSQLIIKERQSILSQESDQFDEYFYQKTYKKYNYSINSFRILSQNLILNSGIITNEKMAQQFIFLFNEQINNLKLIFKASQNQFSMKNFYQNCGKIKNTLIICKTDKQVIFGGYTPLQYAYTGLEIQNDFDKKYHQQSGFDKSRKSFMFQLSSEIQLFLRKDKPAIKRPELNNWIQFGDCDFIISNRANTNNKSYLSFSKNFFNSSYWNSKVHLQKNGKQIFDISALTKRPYTIQQLQVWQIETDQQKSEQ